MEVLLVFLAAFLAFLAATLVQVRYGVLLLILLYGIYPKLFSLGLAEEGFALSAQRAMLYALVVFYLIRGLWGSAEIRSGLDIAARNKAVFVALLVYLLSRLVGNLLAGRMDVGSFGGLVNEFVVSLFTVLLVVTYVRSVDAVLTVITLIVAALFVNQLVAAYEFVSGGALFADTIDIQYATENQGKLLDGSVRGGYFRARGLFDNPLKLAGFLCLVIPLAIALFQASSDYFTRMLAGTSLLLAPFTAVVTGSRTAVAVTALIALWYAYAFIDRRLGRLGSLFLKAVAILVAAGLVAFVASGLAETYVLGDEYARSTESRYLQFVRVPMALAESPLFGFGSARNIIDMLDVGHVDSFFLTTALEGGLVAVLAVVFAMFRGQRLLLEVSAETTDRRTNVLARGMAIAIGLAFLLALVVSLQDIRFYLFLLIGLAIAMHELHKKAPGNA